MRRPLQLVQHAEAIVAREEGRDLVVAREVLRQRLCKVNRTSAVIVVARPPNALRAQP